MYGADMGRKYSGTVTGPDGSEIPFNVELFGPPDAEGFVQLDAHTKIHEGELRAAVEAFKVRGGRVTGTWPKGQGPHVRAHGDSIGVKKC